MKHCFEFLKIYKAFRALVKIEHSVVIKCLSVIWVGSILRINFFSCLR